MRVDANEQDLPPLRSQPAVAAADGGPGVKGVPGQGLSVFVETKDPAAGTSDDI